MKKILAFLALASLTQVTFAVDYDTVGVLTSGNVISATGTAGAAHTCSILSTAEPPVTINLSRDVAAAMMCDTTSNAAGAATQHPGGRPTACNGGRCGYVATTAGGPVTPIEAGTNVPTAAAPGGVITGCATYIAGHTSGTVSATCQ